MDEEGWAEIRALLGENEDKSDQAEFKVIVKAYLIVVGAAK